MKKTTIEFICLHCQFHIIHWWTCKITLVPPMCFYYMNGHPKTLVPLMFQYLYINVSVTKGAYHLVVIGRLKFGSEFNQYKKASDVGKSITMSNVSNGWPLATIGKSVVRREWHLQKKEINSLSCLTHGGREKASFCRWHLKLFFLNKNISISIIISLIYLSRVFMNNYLSLVQIMAWPQTGDKPLSDGFSLLMH